MGREIELKFELPAEAAALVPALVILGDAEGRTEAQRTIYYDTAKQQVRKHGFSLRVRSTRGGFVQTVKALGSGAAMFARDEWESDVPSIDPDLAALAGTPLEELAAAGRLKSLAPVISSEVRRSSWRLQHDGSVIQVDLDEGSMEAGAATTRFTELELELVDGDAGHLIEVARRMAGQLPLRIGVLSKAERGFALADGTLDKFSKAGPVGVAAGMSIADSFEAIVQACLKHFRRNEPVVAERQQMEALHQARVAMRRLRSAFSLFKPVAADEQYERLRGELRWFTGLLGDARNLDVFLHAIDPAEQPAELLERRAQAYKVIIEALDSARFRELMFDLVAWLATGHWRSRKKAQKPVVAFAGKRLDKMWRAIDSTGDLGAVDDEARHELRIRIKKLRYALEFFRALFAHEAGRQKDFAAAVEELQETLGLLNDMVTAEQLAALAKDEAEPEPAPWPLPPVQADDPPAERPQDKLVAESQRCLRRLRKIGPYWASELPAETQPSAAKHETVINES